MALIACVLLAAIACELANKINKLANKVIFFMFTVLSAMNYLMIKCIYLLGKLAFDVLRSPAGSSDLALRRPRRKDDLVQWLRPVHSLQ